MEELFSDEPDDTREAIMQATYHALCRHGYAGLTIQRIGDEFSKSKSLLYHHYDGKDELLLDFLAFMLSYYEETLPEQSYDDARDHLEAILDHALAPDRGAERDEYAAAIVELRAQAATDENYHEHFSRSDRFFRDRLADVVTTGIDQGVFRETDPDRTAAFLLTTMNGAMTRRATTDAAESLADVRRELQAYLETSLYAEVSE